MATRSRSRSRRTPHDAHRLVGATPRSGSKLRRRQEASPPSHPFQPSCRRAALKPRFRDGRISRWALIIFCQTRSSSLNADSTSSAKLDDSGRFRIHAVLHQRVEVQDLFPKWIVQDHYHFLQQFLRLNQVKFPSVHRACRSAGNNDQRLSEIREPELPHEEVVKSKTAPGMNGLAAARTEADVSPMVLRPPPSRAISGLHDPALRALHTTYRRAEFARLLDPSCSARASSRASL